MTVTVDELLSKEKFRLFTSDLSAEELKQISHCRRGILGASTLGAVFGVFGGRIALGPTPASFLLKTVVIGASVITGTIVGAGVSIQQSYFYLKSKPTELAKELAAFSSYKKNIYRSQNQPDLEDQLKEIFNKRIKKLPTDPKE